MSSQLLFSQRLRKLRREKDISQKVLGEHIGCSEGSVSLYEQGKRSPDYEMLLKIADFFSVSTDYLLGKTPIKDEVEYLRANRFNLPGEELPEEIYAEVVKYANYLLEKHENKQSDTNK